MKKISKFSVLLLLATCVFFSSCHVVRFFVWNFADIKDYKKFSKIDMPKGGAEFKFANVGKDTKVILPKEVTIKKKKYDFKSYLKKSKTVAFLVIRNDSVLNEEYLGGYSKESIVASFSMAKSFTSMLMGIAIEEGAIKNVNEPITKYLPELTKPGFEKITIEHLLNMRSGIRFDEGYFNPFGDVAKYYYGVNISKYIKQLKIKDEPDTKFEYISLNTQLLGMIIERAVHKSLADYMEEKIWKNIGTEYDASWSIDSKRDKEVKAFCCFNARPIDFAKLGRLYLNKGNWNGKQIVPKQWVEKSIDIKSSKNDGIYTYQWWHTWQGKGADFFAEGLLGQFVYVYPSKNIIIVRLGKKEGKGDWPYLMKAIAEAN